MGAIFGGDKTRHEYQANIKNQLQVAQTMINDSKKRIVSEYAPEYCKSHKNTIVTNMQDGWPVNDGRGWTNDECSTIVSRIFDKSGINITGGIDGIKASVDDIKNKLFCINIRSVQNGMTLEEVTYTMGDPDKVNISNYGRGNQYQMVYDHTYIYLNDKLKVVSYQKF